MDMEILNRKELKKAIARLQLEIECHKMDIGRLREALRFYANKGHLITYKRKLEMPGEREPIEDVIEIENGAHARKILGLEDAQKDTP